MWPGPQVVAAALSFTSHECRKRSNLPTNLDGRIDKHADKGDSLQNQTRLLAKRPEGIAATRHIMLYNVK
jgi:hypothetical protein